MEKMFFNFRIMMAQNYTDAIRDNVARSNEYKIQNGEYPNRAPIGYLNVRDENGKSILFSIVSVVCWLKGCFRNIQAVLTRLVIYSLCQKNGDCGIRIELKATLLNHIYSKSFRTSSI